MDFDELDDVSDARREYIVITPLGTGHSQAGGLVTGNPGKTVTAQHTFKVPQEFTVTVDLDTPTQGITAYAQAIVEFTVKGVTIIRTMDVAAGCSISGVANAVKVTVVDVTARSHPQGLAYNAAILIAINPRPTSAVPVIATALAATTVAGGGTQTLAVPRGATSIAVYLGSSSSTATVACQALDGTNILQTTLTGQFIPLPAGTGQVVITNGAGSAVITALWGLDG